MRSATILVVDDQPDNRFVIQQLIDEYLPDCTVIPAGSGSEGLKIATAAHLDLALIDLQMPVMDGKELCRCLKSFESTANFPVVLMTVHRTTPQLRTECLQAGADDFICKPIDNLELIAKIKVMLRIKQAEDQLRRMNVELENQVEERTRSLRKSEEKYRDLIENLNDIIYAVDTKGILTYISSSVESFSGYASADLIGKSYMEFFHAEDVSQIVKDFQRVISGQTIVNEYRAVLKTGDTRWVRTSSRPIFEGKRVVGLQGVLTDVTERKQAEQELRNSEVLYHSLVENIPQFIFRKDLQGRFTFANDKFCRLLGKKPMEIVGKTDFDFFPADLAEKYKQDDQTVIHTQQILETVEENQNRSGEKMYVQVIKTPMLDAAGNTIGVQGIFWDITEYRRLEEQLRQAQKMEALGTLAGGIAHDFNNILSPIIGYTELALQQDCPPQSALHHKLDMILKAAERAKNLVQQILAFSRKSDIEKVPLSLATLVKEVLKLLRSSLPSTVEIQLKLESTPTILGNPTQIHQVLLNLCTNAADAMQEQGGILEIGIQEAEVDEAVEKLPFFELKPGRYACLRIKDTGRGIDPSIRDRIFDPFFTTKEVGKGTGLGLSVVLGIIKSYEGALSLQSAVGEGTEFKVYLPLISEAIGSDQRQEKVTQGSGETILLVDDEEMLVQVGRHILSKLGYQVVPYTSSIEALKAFRSNPMGFDLVLTDLTMPKMKGTQLAQELIKIRSDIPIILYTGYDECLIPEQVKEMGIREILMKPFLMQELSSTCSKVLKKKKVV